MGIFNVIFDFFFDGGCYDWLDDVLWYVECMVWEGVMFIDVGGELICFGVCSVFLMEELEWVVLVVECIVCELDVVILVDIFMFVVMCEIVCFGVGLINDVCLLQCDGVLDVVVDSGLVVCFMYMCGELQIMQDVFVYQDVVVEVGVFLQECVDVCVVVGIDCEWLLLDLGFGFVKILEYNLVLFRYLQVFYGLGLLLLVGVLCKSMIGKVLGWEVDECFYGSLVLVVLVLVKGVWII